MGATVGVGVSTQTVWNNYTLMIKKVGVRTNLTQTAGSGDMLILGMNREYIPLRLHSLELTSIAALLGQVFSFRMDVRKTLSV